MSDTNDSFAGTDRRVDRRLLLPVGLLLLALAAGVAVWFRTPAPKPPALDLQGADPDVAAAIDRALAAVRESPRSGQTWGQLGMVLFAHRFVAESKTCFAHAQELDPHEPRWPYFLGEILAYGDPEAAIVQLQRAVALAGSQTAPRLRLGSLLLIQGRAESAEQQYQAVLEHDPKNPWALLGMGRVACARGKDKQSVPLLKRAAGNSATEKAARLLLGEVLQRLGDGAAAADQSRRAAQLSEPAGWPEPWFDELWQLEVGQKQRLRQAEDLLRQGQPSKAIGLLQQLTRRAPKSAEAWLKLGVAVVNHSSDWNEAERALLIAVRLKPDSADAHLHLGLVQFRKNDFAAATASFRKATELRPAYGLAHFNLAHALERQGDRKAALAALRQAISCRPDFADAHIELGVLLTEMGQPAAARQHLERGAELKPADPRPRALLEKVKQ